MTPLRRAARAFGLLVAALMLAVLVFESVEYVVSGSRADLPWALAGLLGLAASIAGLVVAWWRPLEGGILAILGALVPIAEMTLGATLGGDSLVGALLSPFDLPVLAGALHVIDGLRAEVPPTPGNSRLAKGRT